MNTDAWIVPEWPAPQTVRAVVTTRNGPGISQSPFDAFNLGARCGDDPQVVAQNRARLREALQLPSAPRWLRQVHGTGVAEFNPGLPPDFPPQTREGEELRSALAPPLFTREEGTDAKDLPEEPDADAAHTRTPGVVLAILTADCMPVLFCAHDGSEIAAAHAGWRGLCAGVLEDTLAAMRTSREGVLAWLGPAIGAHSYEVGNEVRQAFLEHDRAAAQAFQPTRPGHWSCDLYALARQRLHAAGIMQISGGGFDTFTDPRLYSYRRDGARSGRFATLIWMEGQNNR
ncbi:MAG TPA: peptidoglycan editing factor PgeF [Rhodanobacteraceae bacterium]|nr:peptidoglycan editing factor PgeF [Rhodanobacteraceae bacterium]